MLSNKNTHILLMSASPAPRSYATFQINYVLGDGGRSWLGGYSKSSFQFLWHKMVRDSTLLWCTPEPNMPQLHVIC